MPDKRQIVLIVMDGIGIGEREYGSAVKVANTSTLDRLLQYCS